MPLMWGNVSDIMCNIFGRVWLLKNFFFKCLYFSEYDIRMLLFVFWLRNRPSINNVCDCANRSSDTYLLNQWPQTNFVEYFLCIGSAKYTRTSPSARKMSLFSSIIITIILSYAITRIYIILHIYLQISEINWVASRTAFKD